MNEQNNEQKSQTFILIVEIVCAKNIPKRKTKPDPYVSIFYQGNLVIGFISQVNYKKKGIKKKTTVKKSEQNPEWNEKFEFDLKGIPLQQSDVIEVLVKDYENIGSNKYLIKNSLEI